MIVIKNKNNVDTLVFAKTFEKEALDQITNLCNFEPYLDSKIRIMPDAHAGKGCTVGTTMTITDKVTPNLIGVDLGCGMLTVKLKDKEVDFEKLDRVISEKIPHGFNIHENPVEDFDLSGLYCLGSVDVDRTLRSIGTLGGGNHFIEINISEITGDIYLVIHSGSRNLGVRVCKYHQEKAIRKCCDKGEDIKELVKRLKSEGRGKDIENEIKNIKSKIIDKDLAYLTGDDMCDYMNDMYIAQNYASLNREAIADIIIKEMGWGIEDAFKTVHNYIDMKRNILRKGAVSAEKGKTILIPMNMKDGSLLCIGKGNEDWNYSAPHGAGRIMSRNKAKEQINVDEYKSSMDGIYSTSVCVETLDEAPQAYKPMEEIIECIKDTVNAIDVLKPIYNFKSH